jgi:hypothetical protein
MLKQIFRKIVPPNLLFEILEKVCLKTEKYYVIDLNAYKKLIFHNLHVKMANDLLEYYHVSKQFYVTRKMTYNSFINIVRHVCKNSNIMYSSQIKYNESKYNINYYVYYNNMPSIVLEYNEEGKPEIKHSLSSLSISNTDSDQILSYGSYSNDENITF